MISEDAYNIAKRTKLRKTLPSYNTVAKQLLFGRPSGNNYYHKIVYDDGYAYTFTRSEIIIMFRILSAIYDLWLEKRSNPDLNQELTVVITKQELLSKIKEKELTVGKNGLSKALMTLTPRFIYIYTRFAKHNIYRRYELNECGEYLMNYMKKLKEEKLEQEEQDDDDDDYDDDDDDETEVEEEEDGYE